MNQPEHDMVTPLSNFTVMRTSDADECLTLVSRHLLPHEFQAKGGGSPFKAVLNNVKLAASTLIYLRYSTGINVGTAAEDDSYLVLVPLSGMVRISYDKSEAELSRQRGVVIEPGHPFAIETNVPSSALIWKIPRCAVNRATQDMIGVVRRRPVRFAPFLDWQCRRTARLHRSLDFVAQELDAIDFSETGAAHQVKSLEQMLIRTLIGAQPNNVHEDPAFGGVSVAPGCVRKVEEYVAEHSDLPITIADLASIAGVSTRSLHRAFQQFRGVSPMAHLREVRLHHIRRDLLAGGPGTSVSQILAQRGVFEFGRFSAGYRECYGETPSQTLRQSGSG